MLFLNSLDVYPKYGVFPFGKPPTCSGLTALSTFGATFFAGTACTDSLFFPLVAFLF